MALVSEYFANELLKLSFNRDTYTAPYDQFSVCLVTAIPTLNTDVVDLAEPPTANGYARMTIPFNTANWTPNGFREIYNVNAVTYAAATALWPIAVEGYALITSLSSNSGYASNVVVVGRLTVPLKVTTGVQPQIAAGGISFGLYD